MNQKRASANTKSVKFLRGCLIYALQNEARAAFDASRSHPEPTLFIFTFTLKKITLVWLLERRRSQNRIEWSGIIMDLPCRPYPHRAQLQNIHTDIFWQNVECLGSPHLNFSRSRNADKHLCPICSSDPNTK